MSRITLERRGHIMQTALRIVKKNGGQMASKEATIQIGKEINLTEYEKGRYKKTGSVRWESILNFHSITCIKAGWLRKQQGIWYITDEGIEALKPTPLEFSKRLIQKYKDWEGRR